MHFKALAGCGEKATEGDRRLCPRPLSIADESVTGGDRVVCPLRLPFLRNLLGLALFASLSMVALAQTGPVQTGVLKAEGQVIPGAVIKATQGDKILSTMTGEKGEFQLEGITPGDWVIEADMFGF